MNDLAIDVCYLGDCVCGGRPNDDPRSFNDARLVDGIVEEAPRQPRLILGSQIKRLVDGNSVHSRLQGAGLVFMVGVLKKVVLAIGRTLSWEELGRTLESDEGWRFRVVIEDSIDDVRGRTPRLGVVSASPADDGVTVAHQLGDAAVFGEVLGHPDHQLGADG